MSYEQVQKLIKDHDVEFVDLRFADVLGKQHHVTFPAVAIDAGDCSRTARCSTVPRSPAGRASTNPTWC
jgi:glutamine synthetase